MYIVYLDEFGHIGPYVSRTHARYNESPVFGMAGIILPADQARNFAVWFFQQKSNLLAFEIKANAVHPAIWEKKGAQLYTTKNVLKYRELRAFTNRLLNQIRNLGGHVIYVGLHKQTDPTTHKPSLLYISVLREMVRRINALCQNASDKHNFLMVMDEHQDRQNIISAISKMMFGKQNPSRRLIEPPFQVESHRYQTIQAADWICGLVGRLGCYQTRPEDYADMKWAEEYFGARIRQASVASGIRNDRRLQETTLIAENLENIL